MRSYSLSVAAGRRGYRISVKREPHGVVSGYLHAQLQLGESRRGRAARRIRARPTATTRCC